MISRLTLVFAVIVVMLAFVLSLLHFTGGAPCGTGRHQMASVEDQQTSLPTEPCQATAAEHGLRAAEVAFWVCLGGFVLSGGVYLVGRKRA